MKTAGGVLFYHFYKYIFGLSVN